MTRRTLQIIDGKEIKSSYLWDDEDTSGTWQYLSNAPVGKIENLYRTIPVLYRGIGIISDACQKVPFTISRGDTEVDTSADWKNKIDVMPNPRRLIWLISQSIDRYGRAYLLKVKNRANYDKDLKWLNPTSIRPILDEKVGLQAFERTIGTRTDRLKPEDVIYFWLPDPDVELGPPLAYPLVAALQAAGVLDNLGNFISKYFERGAIRPLVVTARGMPSKEERERMEGWFAKLFGGIRNAFKIKIFNAETMDFKQVGDGLDQLQDQTLTSDQRQDVALALGIPTSILFAGASNFATAIQENRGFFDNTILPRVEFIASVFNEQLLDPQGLHIEFQPEELDMYQQDESERSGALGQLTGAGVPLLTAMDILGYDLTDEQRAAIEEAEAEPEPQPQPPQLQPGAQPEQLQQVQAADAQDTEAQAEMKRWQRACHQAHRKGKPLPVDWEAQAIDPEDAKVISAWLYVAKTPGDIKAAFGAVNELKMKFTAEAEVELGLVQELKRANDLLERAMM